MQEHEKWLKIVAEDLKSAKSLNQKQINKNYFKKEKPN